MEELRETKEQVQELWLCIIRIAEYFLFILEFTIQSSMTERSFSFVIAKRATSCQ